MRITITTHLVWVAFLTTACNAESTEDANPSASDMLNAMDASNRSDDMNGKDSSDSVDLNVPADMSNDASATIDMDASHHMDASEDKDSSGGNPPQDGVGLSAQYPDDEEIGSDPDVIFHSDFESGLAGWDVTTNNDEQLNVESNHSMANGGERYLRTTITRSMLEENPYISAKARKIIEPEDEIYWRFYARFEGNTAPPHHWVRAVALNETYSADGHAGYKPSGDDGFWFALDPLNDDTFKFYTYWHEMHSWMCNDGSTSSDCAGYNGPSSSPHYGNNFNYVDQTAFPRDEWFCVEIHGKANTPGSYDGALSFYINNKLVANYETGQPNGRWLRESFYTQGQYYRDDGPFEGFNFRTDSNVAWRQITLDSYYQKDTLDRKEANGYPVQEEQTILYDDVVVARRRIGCKVAQ